MVGEGDGRVGGCSMIAKRCLVLDLGVLMSEVSTTRTTDCSWRMNRVPDAKTLTTHVHLSP